MVATRVVNMLDGFNPITAGTNFRRQNLPSYRRQIMTSKVGPRTNTVKYF